MEAATQPDAHPTPIASHAADRLIVALDFSSADEALRLVDQLQHTCRWFKVGMELYYAAGNEIIDRLLQRDLKVFLDLKLHDIPNTVAGAIRSVAGAGASLLTLHAGGGEQMMRAAAQAASSPGAPELLAVTVLTSMDSAQLSAAGVVPTEDPAVMVQSQVLRLAHLARTSGINGLVCSAEEVATVREAMGPNARLVVPGIRPAASPASSTPDTPDDQRRIATPAQAIARGASMLVVGRPITQAPDPAAAAAAILTEIASVL
ncbi:MAG TPA: orotidine-5'-phosphate decarboxylase [Acidobacteriaceae bacterium]|nr:orotidine-5'-phosphate decarboxylase [Acidobacteriaceae bacterium]